MVGGSYVAGAEITTLNLIRDLHLKGYHVFVIVSSWNDGDFIQRLGQYGIPYQDIKLGFIFITKPFWTLDSLVNYPKAFLQVKKIIKNFKPNCIFHSSYRTFIMVYPLLKGLKNIYLEHNNPTISQKNFKLYNFLSNKIHHFVCPSQTVRKTLLELNVPPAKIKIIPSPIDPEFRGQTALNHLENEVARIGIVGQIHAEKGFDFIFDELVKVTEPYQLYIYGDDHGEYARSLKLNMPDILKNKVNWMGYVKNRLEIYQQLDIVLFPSLSESFGRIIIEAGAFGIPIIASDIDSFKEIIVPGETGFLFKLSNTGELPQILDHLLSDKSLRKKIGSNAQTFILNNFTSEKCTKEYENLIAAKN